MKFLYVFVMIWMLAGCSNKHIPGAELSAQDFPPVGAGRFDKSETDRGPRVLAMRNPDYPRELIDNGIKATVGVSFVVGVDGSVHVLRVLDAPHPLFVSAVLAATQDWRFEPALRNGRPLAVKLTAPITFDFY